MKLTRVVALALLAAAPIVSAQEFRGRLIFSVEVIEWSLQLNEDGGHGPKQRTGVFYYYEEGKPGVIGPSMTGYNLREGKVIELSGAGSVGTERFMKDLTALPLSAFDVQEEIDRTEKELRARNGPLMIVADGARYRIRYDFNGVSVDYTGWNPGSYIDWLAPYNEKLRQLKAVIDLFATQYGRRQFGL